MSTEFRDPVSELAVAEGERLARRIFERRGNNSEVHVTEAQLGAMLAIAFHRGELKAWREKQRTSR